jgi:hypothetical protein
MSGGPEDPLSQWIPSAPDTPAGAPYTPQKTSGFAVASLVLGIIGLPIICPLLIPSVLAVVFGLLGRRDVREKGHSGEGMALAGLIMGIIGIMVSVVLLTVGIVFLAGADWHDPDNDGLPNFLDDHDHNPNLDVIRPVAMVTSRLLLAAF